MPYRIATPRARALAALIVLAALQLAFAGHQFVHTTGDVSSVCGVCLQLDRMDDALAESPDFPACNRGFAAPAAVQHVNIGSDIAPSYKSRAPPKV